MLTRMRVVVSLFAAVTAVFSLGSVRAAGNLVVNGDFEAKGFTGNFVENCGSDYLIGWTCNKAGIATPQGTYLSKDIAAYDNSAWAFLKSVSSLSQGIAISAPGTYRLEFDFAGRAGYLKDAVTVVSFGDQELLVIKDDGASENGSKVDHRSVDFEVNAPGTYALTFAQTTNGDKSPAFDNVSLVMIAGGNSLSVDSRPAGLGAPSPAFGDSPLTPGEQGAAASVKATFRGFVSKTVRADGYGETLADAVKAMSETDMSETDEGEIILEAGDYPLTETLTIAKPITVRSASGDPADVTIRAAKTQTCRVLFLDHPDARLVGVTVRDGYATGKEQNYSAANVTLLQGAVMNCWITSGTLGAIGDKLCNCAAGIYVEKGRVSDCRIFGNIGKQSTYDCAGIGLCLADETALVERCEIYGNKNTATEYGMAGGARILAGTLTDSIITNNISYGNAGGVYIDNGNLINCLVAFNMGCCQSTGRRAGGVYSTPESSKGQWAVISNCTIACNSAYQNGGVFVTSSTDRTKFYNTIVWGNGEVAANYTGWPNIQNAYAQSVKNCWFGYTANKLESRTDDPCFVDPWKGDFRLQACSPCVGMGYLPDTRTGAFVTISARTPSRLRSATSRSSANCTALAERRRSAIAWTISSTARKGRGIRVRLRTPSPPTRRASIALSSRLRRAAST